MADNLPISPSPGAESVRGAEAWARLKNTGRLRWFPLAALLLVACFGKPLLTWARFAAGNELYSHTLLIPFISLYLVWSGLGKLSGKFEPASVLAFVPAAVGAVVLGCYWAARNSGATMALDDVVAAQMVAFVCFVIAACLFLGGREMFRAMLFPLLFLFFMAPFPVVVVDGIEYFFQHTSAWAADLFFNLTGAPVLRVDLLLYLPSTQILRIAPACSGIHSSLALFITSLLAGQLMLRGAWRRAALTLFVIPLGIARNGFRIFFLTELCMHVSPKMIDSPVHHHGGPIFFALSLIPFFAVLIFLVRWRPGTQPMKQTHGGTSA